MTCSGGVCTTPTCTSDVECGGVECILPGTCSLKRDSGEGAPCDLNDPVPEDACPPGLTCDGSGQCLHPTCMSDSDCSGNNLLSECWESEGICVLPAKPCTTADETNCPGTCNTEAVGQCAPKVYQVFMGPSGEFRRTELDAEFDTDPAHEHVHFGSFADMSVYRESYSNGFEQVICAETPPSERGWAWEQNCGLGIVNRKLSFCLLNIGRFDEEIESRFAHQATIESTGCGLSVQQIQAGWKDVYDKDIVGQLFILERKSDSFGNWTKLASLAGTPVTIEADIDPEGKIIERNNSNNRAWAGYTIPAFDPENISQSCERIVECDSTYSTDPHYDLCKDYF